MTTVEMKWPATCKTITQGFGNPSSRYVGGKHTGIDLGCMAGSPIYAATDGLVTTAGYQGAYGNTVRVKYNDTLTTGYHHMSQIKARVGQNVSAGTVIGYIGSTGNSTGPHLHFEVLINGTAVDPAPYLKGATVIQASADAQQASVFDMPGQVVTVAKALSNPITWERVGMVLLGAVLLGITFFGLTRVKGMGTKALGAVKGMGTSGKS